MIFPPFPGCAGERLVAAWHLPAHGPRAVLRDQLDSDDLEWARGKARAFEQAMRLVWYYAETSPLMSALGRGNLNRQIASCRQPEACRL